MKTSIPVSTRSWPRSANDTYTVDNAGDNVVEADGAGTDVINSSVTYSLSGRFVETLALTGSGNINATGNSKANILVSNSVFSSVSFVLGNNVENLTLTGAANLNGTGNTRDNFLTGNDGDNSLDGGRGHDVLTGGAGADTFVFGLSSGADTIADFSATDGDTIDLQAYHAQDTAIFTQLDADTVIDLGAGNTVTILNTTSTDTAFLSHIVW